MEPWMWVAGGAVLLLAVVWAARSIRPRPPAPPALPAAPVRIDAATATEIDALLARGEKIAAIKLLRERTGLGLADAKHRVDAWDSRTSVRPGPAAAGGGAAAAAHPGPTPETHAEIDRLVAEGRLIEAIKRYRAATGLGLRESKAAIERWR